MNNQHFSKNYQKNHEIFTTNDGIDMDWFFSQFQTEITVLIIYFRRRKTTRI